MNPTQNTEQNATDEMKKSDSIGSLRSGDSKRVHMTNGSTTYDTSSFGTSRYGEKTSPYGGTTAAYNPVPTFGTDAVSPTSYDTAGTTSYGASNDVGDIIELSDAGWCTASFHLDNGNFTKKSSLEQISPMSSRIGNRTLNHQSNAVRSPVAVENGYSHSTEDRRIWPTTVNDVSDHSEGSSRSVASGGGVGRPNKRSTSRSRLAIKFVGGELSSSSGLKDHTSSGSQPRTSSSSRNASLDTGPTFEELSSEHFPYTLRAAGAVDGKPGLNGGGDITAGTTRDQRATSGRYSSMNHRRQHRGSSTRSSSSSTSTSSYDRGIYLLDDHNIASPTVLMSTPYQFDLAHLHLEKLRIEEENLLELKRQAELERIRGPQPKWYEMKSTGFHHEVRKHNELMKNRPAWQALYDYRTQLEEASRKYRESDSKRHDES